MTSVERERGLMEITWGLIIWSTVCLGLALANANAVKDAGDVFLPLGVMLIVWSAGVVLAKIVGQLGF